MTVIGFLIMLAYPEKSMPELPEVETIVRQLSPVLTGRTINKVRVFWERSIQGDSREFSSELQGKIISGLERRGKYILIKLAGEGVISVHLRMSGRLFLDESVHTEKHLRLAFDLDRGGSLFFADTRKFGRLRFWPPELEILPRLGPDPLDSSRVLEVLLKSTGSRTVKAFLLDQEKLAGVGNIYADEVLFKCRIHPSIPLKQLSIEKKEMLSRELPLILQAAIERGGTTVYSFRDAENRSGRNQDFLLVYGREGSACPECGEKISRNRVAGRSTHCCPSCQKECD